MHGTSSATTSKIYCRVDALHPFSLLLVLLDLECGGEDNAKATDRIRRGLASAPQTGDTGTVPSWFITST